MKTEELLKPRWKVIAKWPSMPFGFVVGEVVHEQQALEINFMYDEETLNEFPHLFRKLAWWEEREVKDWPEIIKQESNGGFRFFKRNNNLYEIDLLPSGKEVVNVTHPVLSLCVPSTHEEYLTYINSNTKQ